MDGGVSNSIPFSDTKTTITVSPFYGEYDICPKVKSTNFFHVDVSKLSLRICLQNLYLLSQTLFPPDIKVSAGLCVLGVQLFAPVCLEPHPCGCLCKQTKTERSLDRDSEKNLRSRKASPTCPGLSECPGDAHTVLPRKSHSQGLRVRCGQPSSPTALAPADPSIHGFGQAHIKNVFIYLFIYF